MSTTLCSPTHQSTPACRHLSIKLQRSQSSLSQASSSSTQPTKKHVGDIISYGSSNSTSFSHNDESPRIGSFIASLSQSIKSKIKGIHTRDSNLQEKLISAMVESPTYRTSRHQIIVDNCTHHARIMHVHHCRHLTTNLSQVNKASSKNI